MFVKMVFKWIKNNILLILFGFLMFGLGLIQGGKFLQRPSIIVNGNVIGVADLKEQIVANMDTKIADVKSLVDNGFVASKRGKYYYPNGCKLADGLSQTNLIYFDTEQEAINAGYIRQIKCD